MRVLITGGLGYLGGRLAQHLAAQGHRIMLGSRHAGAPPAWLPSAQVVRTPWESADALRELCAGNDAIVHTAGMNAQECAAEPAKAQAFNGGATAALVAAAGRAGARRVIYFSTAHVYRSPLTGVLTEATPPVNPHPYATSHLAGEEAVLAAGRNGSIDGVVVRLTNAVGAPAHPGVNAWMLLANDLCRQAVVARELTLRTSGRQERDFITISDLNHALDRLLAAPGAQLTAGLYNLGGGRSLTVLGMAQLIAARCDAVLRYRPVIHTNPHSAENHDEPPSFTIDRIQQLGWRPENDFPVEIDDTLQLCQRSWGAAV